MKKIYTIICLIILYNFTIEAQTDEYFFKLDKPKTTVIGNSLYNNIELLDSRDNSEFERTKINEVSFKNQLDNILNSMIDETAEDYNLVLQLRNLSIYNDPSRGSYLFLRINLYERNNDDYYFIDTYISLIVPEKNKEFQETASQDIADFISKNLKSLDITSETKILSIEDVRNIDSVEKESIKIYNTNQFTDGVYLTYNDFKNQTPTNLEIKPIFKKEKLKEINFTNSKKKKIKIQGDKIYVAVIDGQPYLSTNKKYIPIYTKDNDFFFEDDISNSGLSVSPSFSLGFGSGGYRGGGIGIDLFNRSQKKHIVFKIDHLTGNFIPQLDH